MGTNATERAIHQLLESLGVDTKGDRSRTPARAAALWRDHLLKGQRRDPAASLGRPMRSRAQSAVILRDLDVHMVCPHHLTVAFGRCHLAYVPAGNLASLGALGELVDTCTSRLVLQEEATDMIAEALVEHLGAKAAVATIEAMHPCHNVTRPHAHRSTIVTWSHAGDPGTATRLEARLSKNAAKRSKGNKKR